MGRDEHRQQDGAMIAATAIRGADTAITGLDRTPAGGAMCRPQLRRSSPASSASRIRKATAASTNHGQATASRGTAPDTV